MGDSLKHKKMSADVVCKNVVCGLSLAVDVWRINERLTRTNATRTAKGTGNKIGKKDSTARRFSVCMKISMHSMLKTQLKHRISSIRIL